MQKEVIDKVSELMTAAFGLIAALAWNEAIKSLFVEGGPLAGAAAYGPWIYAIFVTVIAVVMAIYIGRLAKKAAVTSEKAAKKAKV
jgi:hypothetical protein